MSIRPATEQDIPAITAIYNEVVANSTAVWTEKPDSEADRLAWMKARRALGYPVLVATEGPDVLGYGTFGDFRPWPGYRHSVEHSVYIHAGHRGRGHGRVLIDELISAAAALGNMC
jgi:L-amino acid N-acyltransferase